MRILTFSTLYPNPVMPRHGLFVRERLAQLIASQPVTAEIVAPVPWFPASGSLPGRYAAFAHVPEAEMTSEGKVAHPRYFTLPRLGNLFNPMTIAQAVLKSLASGQVSSDIDLIDAHYAFPDGAAAALVADRLDVPLVLTVRGSDINVWPQNRTARYWIRRTLQRCSALIAVSRDLGERTMAFAPEVADRVQIISNGVDRDRFRVANREAVRERLGWQPGVLLSVGNLVPLKGHDLVIRALRHLQPEVRLKIVGAGPLDTELKSLAQSLGLADRVAFLGSVDRDRLIDYYNAADVTVLASSSEGMPNVVLESLACGTPVVASDIGDLRSVIGDAGRVAGRTPEALALAVDCVMSNPPAPAVVSRQTVPFDWASRCTQIYDTFTRAATRRALPTTP